MDTGFERSFLNDSRRTFRFAWPAAQLRLPLYLLVAALVFAGLFTWHIHQAYAGMFSMLLSHTPNTVHAEVNAQTLDFALVSLVLVVGFALVVFAVCLAYTHVLIGPTVALRRHVQSLKAGNYRSGLKLRKSDRVFQPLADELNELARLLASKSGPKV